MSEATERATRFGGRRRTAAVERGERQGPRQRRAAGARDSERHALRGEDPR